MLQKIDEMENNMELNNDLYTQILQLSKEGDQFINMGRFDDAIKKYKCALELLPDSKLWLPERWKPCLCHWWRNAL